MDRCSPTSWRRSRRSTRPPTRAPGFVWRRATDEGDATAVRAFGDERLIVKLSVWKSFEALRAFVYGQRAPRDVLRHRREWFERLGESTVLLRWVPAGHRPSIAEVEQRLAVLRADGPTPAAFSFRESFAAPLSPGHGRGSANVDPLVFCPAATEEAGANRRSRARTAPLTRPAYGCLSARTQAPQRRPARGTSSAGQRRPRSRLRGQRPTIIVAAASRVRTKRIAATPPSAAIATSAR
jgi:hypothetical protein